MTHAILTIAAAGKSTSTGLNSFLVVVSNATTLMRTLVVTIWLGAIRFDAHITMFTFTRLTRPSARTPHALFTTCTLAVPKKANARHIIALLALRKSTMRKTFFALTRIARLPTTHIVAQKKKNVTHSHVLKILFRS